MEVLNPAPLDESKNLSESLFDQIAEQLLLTGFCIIPKALPPALTDALWRQIQNHSYSLFERAGIGRKQEHMLNASVRSDEICWITGESVAGKNWLAWCGELQKYLNRRLFLGLFSFESHFAHYSPGDFYKRHVDAFKGDANRVLSLVAYLNPEWEENDGGELVIYSGDDDLEGRKVIPSYGTLVVFLSEEFPHEVLPAQRDRYSIAGWFRVNTSIDGKVDPPT